jgi:hypothetical protein
MKRAVVAACTMVVLGVVSSAEAGVYGDDLSKCLVRSATPSDQTSFVVWAFSALSAHPAVRQYSNFTDAKRDELNVVVGKLFERLLTVDCHSEAVAALKYEGAGGMTQSFSVLGQVAFRGLSSDPAVTAQFAGITKGVDEKRMAALAAEAGLPAGILK